MGGREGGSAHAELWSGGPPPGQGLLLLLLLLFDCRPLRVDFLCCSVLHGEAYSRPAGIRFDVSLFVRAEPAVINVALHLCSKRDLSHTHKHTQGYTHKRTRAHMFLFVWTSPSSGTFPNETPP